MNFIDIYVKNAGELPPVYDIEKIAAETGMNVLDIAAAFEEAYNENNEKLAYLQDIVLKIAAEAEAQGGLTEEQAETLNQAEEAAAPIVEEQAQIEATKEAEIKPALDAALYQAAATETTAIIGEYYKQLGSAADIGLAMAADLFNNMADNIVEAAQSGDMDAVTHMIAAIVDAINHYGPQVREEVIGGGVATPTATGTPVQTPVTQ